MYEKDATMVSKFALSKKQWRKIWQAGKGKGRGRRYGRSRRVDIEKGNGGGEEGGIELR